MNAFSNTGPERISYSPRMQAAEVTAQSIRRNLGNKALASGEASKTSFAVRDALFFASHAEGPRLYAYLLPATSARLAVAAEVLGNPVQRKDVRDAIAQPLREVFDPQPSHPWYKRVALGRQLTQLDPKLMRGYQQYDLEQEHAQRRQINRQSSEFIADFLDNAGDVGILQQRLQAMFSGQPFSEKSPLDMWLHAQLQLLSSLPVGDLLLIASHPIGGKLLYLYEQFDRLRVYPNAKTA